MTLKRLSSHHHGPLIKFGATAALLYTAIALCWASMAALGYIALVLI